jgi:PAS domain S-box-containing protein
MVGLITEDFSQVMENAMLVRTRDVLGTALKRLGPSTQLNHPLPVALAAAVLATLLRFALDPFLRDRSPFLLFAVAVVIAALYGGAWAGIGVVLLGIPICDYFFIEPRYTWFIHDARADSITIALFAVLGALTIFIIHRFHQNKRQLRQSLSDLQRTELKLEMITSAIPEIVFSAVDDGTVEYFSAYVHKFSGRDLSTLTGRGWLDLVHRDDRNAIERNFSSLPESDEFETTIRLRRADGVYRAFKCHARKVLDSDGNVRKWFGVLSDVNNEKILSAALESRTQELVRLNEGLERFAYAASHDLQEPLRTIGAMAELFLSRAGGNLDKESSQILASVVTAVSRMKRLIRDVMDLARAADVSSQPAEVDMGAVTELALANLGEAIKESGGSITVEQLPIVHANETAMLRLMQNLIANAIKYRAADRTPEVHVSASLRDQGWTFCVRDNGIGIDTEYREKIFEPFRRLHARAQYEGSGLGLAACLRIVQLLNGRIWVESKPGEGSAFFFTIPPQTDPERSEPAKETGAGIDPALAEYQLQKLGGHRAAKSGA